MKTLLSAGLMWTCALVRLVAESPQYDVYQEKRFVMQMRSQDDQVQGVELIIAKPGDEARSPMQLLEKQAGLKWSGFDHGDVYRFNRASQKWELVMGRDLSSTETVVGGRAGLKISELQSGDVIVCRSPISP